MLLIARVAGIAMIGLICLACGESAGSMRFGSVQDLYARPLAMPIL